MNAELIKIIIYVFNAVILSTKIAFNRLDLTVALMLHKGFLKWG